MPQATGTAEALLPLLPVADRIKLLEQSLTNSCANTHSGVSACEGRSMSVRLSNFGPNRRAISPFVRQLAATSVISALVAAAVVSSVCVVRADETLTVTVDEARVVKVPAGTRTLIIGNPMIADVTLLKSGQTMIVTGKGFGETNFIALDGDGKPVAQSQIRVVSGANALIVQRGMDRQSYTCAPRCQPSARLGDDPSYFNDVAGQIQAHNSQATK